ncbi:MAG TPA: Lin0512 family protein [Aestuariivirga sp.]|nr:Lin0512 family protein [Alphaproteobacteria bacterium]HRX37096.1 Lin0512 family protein [Aestuariivirga sp.]
MAMTRMIVEIGMGTDLTGADYTKAAIRALKDALWHNSLTVAIAAGQKPEDMHVKVLVGVPKPDLVNKDEVLAVLPYGTREIEVVEGGLEIMNDEGTNLTLIANAAAIVSLNLPEA